MNFVDHLLNVLNDLRERNKARKPLVKPAKTVSFAWPVEDATLMLAVSKHFGQSNSTVGTELFAPMIAEIFKMLPADAREQIAAEADQMIVEHVKEYKVTEPVNLTCWQDFNSRGSH